MLNRYVYRKGRKSVLDGGSGPRGKSSRVFF